MWRLLGIGAAALAGLIVLGTQAGSSGQPPSALFDARPGPVLERFKSARSFRRYVRSVERNLRDNIVYEMSAPPSAAESLPGIDGAAQSTEMAQANPEITNNQTIGVDEGGIVKQIGGFLVVLQDGRLFSADLGDAPGAPLRLADRIDVYRSPASAATWYDEMLVSGNRILVTAYNYNEQASEITVFRIDGSGRMTREGRFLLSSNDYYSTENYATRLVGDNLVFYAPLALDAQGPDGRFLWPRLRRADGDGEADGGEALIGPTDVYAPPGEIEWPVLHTLSVCPLRQDMECRTTAFIGSAVRELYVSPTDAFLWIGAPDGLPWDIDYANQRRRACPAGQCWAEGQAALLYRVPLGGGPVAAVAVDGVPADQFAFDSRDGRFRALLARGSATGTGPSAALVLLDLPLSAFQSRIWHASDRAYAALPAIEAGELENRFLGGWLLYGGRSGGGMASEVPAQARGRPAGSTLVAIPLARPAGAVRLSLPHNALRIERAGSDAVVTGYRDGGGLSLSYIGLGRGQPRIAATTMLARRFESEGRSHAFNAWIRADGSGLIGIPTSLRESRAGRGWSDSENSELSFIAVASDKALTPAGELAARGRARPGAYRCQISCLDWYGNSRPIFTGGRIFALMGTDLVEGRLAGGRIGEVGRVDLTGSPAARAAP